MVLTLLIVASLTPYDLAALALRQRLHHGITSLRKSSSSFSTGTYSQAFHFPELSSIDLDDIVVLNDF